MFTALDPLLIGVVIVVMMVGITRRWALWRMGREEEVGENLFGLMGYLLGHKQILKNRYVGIAHLILFWGFCVALLLVIMAQFPFTMDPTVARLLSLVSDILGALMLLGTLFLLIRRIQSPNPKTPKKSLVPLVVLMGILITGFLAEGARLAVDHPGFTWSSPVGWLFSRGLPVSPFFMQIMIRSHFFAVLFIIAILPFTSMRHLAASSLNVYYRKRQPRGELRRMSMDEERLGANTVYDFSWEQLLDAEACVSCGRCEENCPAFIAGKPLSPHKVIQNILEQMETVNLQGIMPGNQSVPLLKDAITSDEIWSCTTCMSCVEHCPVFIDPMDKIIDLRRNQVMARGFLPAEAIPMMKNLELYGDVQGKGIAYRGDWAFNRHVPLIADVGSDAEVLFWVGCSGAFHPRYQEVARAMVEILKAGKVRFGILAKEELCCGDPARRLGNEDLFFDVARKNISRFHNHAVQRIVTLCPHCFNTFKHEYAGLGGKFEVIHATEFVIDLIQQKRIFPKYGVAERIAIHDPCYLGRVNQIYEPLRQISRTVPELELRELNRNRENGFCCGGGGGRMWLHENVGRHINQLRAEEVSEAGVDRVVTACPYCLTMLDDGIKAIEMESPPQVSDIIEIVASSLG